MNGTTYSTLTDSYGQKIVDDYFERVADYEASKGKRYKDHAATVRNWLKRDNIPKQSKPKPPPIRTRDFGKGVT